MNKVVILVGPTGVGKTETAVELSTKINTEIISADSRQVYKYLSVGTNKPKGKWEKVGKEKVFIYKNVPYHLVDFLSPLQQYNAGSFYNDASVLIKKIQNKNKLPLIVGGTGLYIKTITDGISILPTRDESLRKNLLSIANIYGKEFLYSMLSNLDPQRAKEIHPNNLHRIIRSLEIIIKTGQPFSKVVQDYPKTHRFDCIIIGLSIDKSTLKSRIVKRTEEMLTSGMIEETQQLIDKGVPETAPAFTSIGYKWVIKFLKKEISFDLMKENIIKDTMEYIKRQMVWFKKDKRIIWIELDNLNIDIAVKKVYNEICKNLNS